MMKKFLCFLGVLLIATYAWAGSTYLGTETILNRVYDSTNTGLRAKVSGKLTNVTIISSETGVITMGGTGNTNNETISLDFETVANAIVIDSNTGANRFENNLAIRQKDDIDLDFGNSEDATFRWETTGNDNLQLGLATNNASYSGYFTIVSKADLGIANRSPSGTSVDPVLRVYSGDGTQADDYIEMYHDQSNPFIKIGSGNLNLDCAGGRVTIYDASTPMVIFNTDKDTDEYKLCLDDDAGNQFVVTNFDNRNVDHDHALGTHPTLYVHSRANPDDINTEYISISHTSADALIASGKGGIVQTVPLSQPSIGVAQRMSFYLDEGANKLMITIVSPDNVTYTSTLDLT